MFQCTFQNPASITSCTMSLACTKCKSTVDHQTSPKFLSSWIKTKYRSDGTSRQKEPKSWMERNPDSHRYNFRKKAVHIALLSELTPKFSYRHSIHRYLQKLWWTDCIICMPNVLFVFNCCYRHCYQPTNTLALDWSPLLGSLCLLPWMRCCGYAALILVCSRLPCCSIYWAGAAYRACLPVCLPFGCCLSLSTFTLSWC